MILMHSTQPIIKEYMLYSILSVGASQLHVICITLRYESTRSAYNMSDALSAP